jgi:hypothetical protein
LVVDPYDRANKVDEGNESIDKCHEKPKYPRGLKPREVIGKRIWLIPRLLYGPRVRY